MSENDEPPNREQPGRDQRRLDLIVLFAMIALVAGMVWLARELTHANQTLNCVARGLRDCG